VTERPGPPGDEGELEEQPDESPDTQRDPRDEPGANIDTDFFEEYDPNATRH
jgi:hypothetical protein